MAPTALVHDYLTQRGGAERVVLSLLEAFPGAPLHTSLYEPATTFPDFAAADVRVSPLDRAGILRSHHRLALPLLPLAFSRLRVDADVAVCSSSGWAHGAQVSGRKLVYCHAPARWLYQTERYLSDRPGAASLAIRGLGPLLRRWDARAAASADRYVVNSAAVRQLVQDVYGREAEVVAPPHTIDPTGPQRPLDLESGFYLCVSRLLPYKNVDAVLRAFEALSDHRLVVVGTGPDERRLRALAPPNARLVGRVEDDELRWLYARSVGLVAASWEDYGLTPLEAAAFGKPTAALAFGGFLDTVVPGRTGLFFEQPKADAIGAAVLGLAEASWDSTAIEEHAEQFSEPRFVEAMRRIVEDERSHL